MNDDYVKGVNRTYSRQFSKNQFIPKILPKYLRKTDLVLDFGAGFDAYGTMVLRRKGYRVVAYDIGRNFNPAIHDPAALGRKYDVIFASNVVNVQPSAQAVQRLIFSLQRRLKPHGRLVFNYPPVPRKSTVTVPQLEGFIMGVFPVVSKIASSPPTWLCRVP